MGLFEQWQAGVQRLVDGTYLMMPGTGLRQDRRADLLHKYGSKLLKTKYDLEDQLHQLNIKLFEKEAIIVDQRENLRATYKQLTRLRAERARVK